MMAKTTSGGTGGEPIRDKVSAAEWDTQSGDWRVWMGRLSWYGAGIAFALIIFALHPSPVADLNLVLAPDQGQAMVYGLLFGGAFVGIVDPTEILRQ